MGLRNGSSSQSEQGFIFLGVQRTLFDYPSADCIVAAVISALQFPENRPTGHIDDLQAFVLVGRFDLNAQIQPVTADNQLAERAGQLITCQIVL